MERIPIIPAESNLYGKLFCGELAFNGLIPEIIGEKIPFEEAKSKIDTDENRGKAMILDVKGISKGSINEKLLKNLKIRGVDVWFMTSIRFAEDVFDAFNTDAELVFMPLHLINDETELEDIAEISDSSVPTVFVRNGKGKSFDGEKDVVKIAEEIFRLGYYSVCVFDIDDSLETEKWELLKNLGNIVPFTRKNIETEFSLVSDYFRIFSASSFPNL